MTRHVALDTLTPEEDARYRRQERHNLYWIGYRHGRRIAEHDHLTDREPALRLELQLAGAHHRAFALGELRGYRQTVGLPLPLEGHRLIG
jgi:hypothetical protein